MLEITIPEQEFLNHNTNEFYKIPGATLRLEHSLISVKRWEEKWHIPFLKKDPPKTPEQLKDYIRCMTINTGVDPIVYDYLPKDVIDKVAAYIEDPMTATWFGEAGTKKKTTRQKKIVTAELIYYLMISFNIPVEFQKWHLNQLLTLIQICEEENKPPEKKSQAEIARSNRELNEYRKKMFNTRG